MTQDTPAARRRNGWLTGISLVGGSLIVSLLLGEVAVRVIAPQRLYYNVSQWDPDVGFTEIPKIRSLQHNHEYRMTIRINSRGLRDREFSFDKPPRTIRVGAFGDSFTFGEGVESEQTYPKLLEQLFAHDARFTSAGWRVEVLNFGIGKTGTSHQLAWYRKEGVRYHLDVVMLGFFAGNDFEDNVSGVYQLRGGELVHNRSAYSSIRRIQSVVYAIPGYRWLAEHSHLLNLIRVAATTLDDRRRRARAVASVPASDQEGDYAVELTRRLIEAFAREARANGSRFLLLYLPGKHERPLADYQPSDSIPRYVLRVAALQERLKGLHLETIDFVPVFAALPWKTYYYNIDGHWRPAGHEVVAREVYQRLASDLHGKFVSDETQSRKK
jgi:hypothetical protein